MVEVNAHCPKAKKDVTIDVTHQGNFCEQGPCEKGVLAGAVIYHVDIVDSNGKIITVEDALRNDQSKKYEVSACRDPRGNLLFW